MDIHQLFSAYGITAPSFRVSNGITNRNPTNCQIQNDEEGMNNKESEEAFNSGCPVLNSSCNIEEGRVSENDNTVRPLTFAEAVSGNAEAVPIKPPPPPRFEGGNIIVEVDEADYEKEVLLC